MFDNSATTWFQSNPYDAEAVCNPYKAEAVCTHCAGVFRHEPWCITHDPIVAYAYEIVAEPKKITLGDALILRGLGVIWADA
jgi:hypothetical protein